MLAVMLEPGNRLALKEVPKPERRDPGDALVRVTTSAICGSDLHALHGLIPGLEPGTIMGHEFVGEIAEIGPAVNRFKPGDRVAAPAAIWCGGCPACRRGDVQYCGEGGMWGGGAIYGPGLDGAQTAFVRVPYADVCLAAIPDHVSDPEAVFVGDVFSTGYHAARQGRIKTGDVVAVWGCGPIGLAAVIGAWLFGPSRVLAVDALDNRLALAERYGATPLDVRRESASEQIRRATGGRGADVVIEAIGNPNTFLETLKAVRRGGTVSVVGMFPAKVEFPLGKMAAYGVNIHMGLSSLKHMDRLLDLLASGRVDLRPLVTHEFALDQALEAYELFENHKDQCLKVLLKP